jgi:hypothetical protein
MYTPGVRMALTDTWLKANDGKERAALAERSGREGLGVRITPINSLESALTKAGLLSARR